MVGTGGFEPPTSCVSSKRSTPELRPYKKAHASFTESLDRTRTLSSKNGLSIVLSTLNLETTLRFVQFGVLIEYWSYSSRFFFLSSSMQLGEPRPHD